MDCLPDAPLRIPCPFCREMILDGAIKCKHCGSDLRAAAGAAPLNADASFVRQPMKFAEAIQTCFRKYFNFKDRAGRPEFWYFYLYGFIFDVLIQIINGGKDSFDLLWIVWNLIIFIPQISVAVRRLHDVNRSGWWNLLAFTLIGIIPLLYWWAKAGDKESNRFGTIQALAGHKVDTRQWPIIRNILFGIGILALGIFIIRIISDRFTGVEVFSRDENIIVVKSIASTPVTIKDIKVNNRPECSSISQFDMGILKRYSIDLSESDMHKVWLAGQAILDSTFTTSQINPTAIFIGQTHDQKVTKESVEALQYITLKTGDSKTWSAYPCNSIVNVKIETNFGTAVYTFDDH